MTSNPTDLIERLTGLIADRWENCDSITAEWIEAAANTLTQQESEIEALREAGNKLSLAAQTSGGIAGRDAGLVAAIDAWAALS